MSAVDDLRAAGATIVDPARVEGLEAIRRPQGVGPCMGFKYDINRYLASHGDEVPVKSLAEIVKSGRFHPTVQRRLEQANDGAENGPETPACKAETEYREQVRAAVIKTMDAQKLDAFVYPTWSNPPRLIGDLNTPGGDNSQFFSPTTGFPVDPGADGLHARRPAGGHHVLRARVVRADADQAGLQVRAGDASSAAAGVNAAAAIATRIMALDPGHATRSVRDRRRTRRRRNGRGLPRARHAARSHRRGQGAVRRTLAADRTAAGAIRARGTRDLALNHPHICALYDVGEAGPIRQAGAADPFLVLEYLEGQTLARRSSRLRRSASPTRCATRQRLPTRSTRRIAPASSIAISSRRT